MNNANLLTPAGKSLQTNLEPSHIDGENSGFTTVGDEFTISTTHEWNIDNPLLVQLSSGNVLALWDSPHGGYGQILTPEGEKVGEEFTLPGVSDAAALDDGGFVLVWKDSKLYNQVFDDEGNEVTDATLVSKSSGLTEPEVTVLDGGNFVVTWTSASFTSSGNTLGSMGRIFDGSGEAVSEEIQLSYTSYGTQSVPVIVPQEGGGFLAFYSSDQNNNYGAEIYSRVFSASGTSSSSTQRLVNGSRAEDQTEPEVAVLADGHIVIVYSTGESTLSYQNTEILGRILDSSGRPVGSEFQVNTLINNNQANAKVYALADGGFIVTWESGDLSYGLHGGYAAQRFDADGNALGEEFQIESTTLAVFSSSLMVSWTDGTLQGGVYSFELETNVVEGGDDNANDIGGTTGADIIDAGAGNDTVSGGAGADSIVGGDGDDLLLGEAGHDTVRGGDGNDRMWAGEGDDGNDVLYGGNGNDTLGGGAGADLLNGGAGTDRIYGGIGGDTLIGGDGIDYLYGGAGADLIVSGNWDGETMDTSDTGLGKLWGGAGDDTIYGANGDDTIGGAAGDDVIYGAAGNDVIYAGNDGYDTIDGGAGDDRIYANYGKDVVTGGDGDDDIWAGSGNDYVNGGDGSDTIHGGQGVDTINGGAGDDILYVGTTNDLLVFEAGSGDDIVMDFDTLEDTLDLSDTVTDFQNSNDVVAAATLTDDGVLIDLGGGDSVLLMGLAISDLDTMLFQF